MVNKCHLEEVVQVFENTNANLIQVFEETIEDGDKVGRCQLVSQDNRQLVDGESQRTPHLPLRGEREGKTEGL